MVIQGSAGEAARIVASHSYTCRDGRLHRSPPLPRAVRKPVPARLPGEVPRLGARDPLVAREPDCAAGCLSRRREPALERKGPALPALPARRAHMLALLLDLGAGRVALASRQ